MGGGWNDSKNPGASDVKYTTTTAEPEQDVELGQSNYETTHFVSTTDNNNKHTTKMKFVLTHNTSNRSQQQ